MVGLPGLPCSGGGGPVVGAASGSRLVDSWGLSPKGGRVLQGQRQRTMGQRSPAPDCAERTGDEGRLGAGNSPAGDRASGGRVESGVNPGPGRAKQKAARKTRSGPGPVADNESLLLGSVTQARFARGRSYRTSTLLGHNGESKEWSHRSRPLRPRAQPGGAAPLRREAPGVGEAEATGRPDERPSASRAEKPGRTNHKPPPDAWVAPKVARGLSSGPLLAAAAARPPRPRPQARGRSVGLRRTYGGDELYDLNFFLVRGKYRWWWQR